MRNGTALDAAYEYCREVTRRGSSNFYYGFLLLPPDQRRAIYSAYAFSRECDDIVDGDAPREESERLLDMAGEAFERCLVGEPDGPVLEALAATIRTYDIPPQHFRDLMAGMRMDLTVSRYATFDELRSYCYLAASTVGLVCAEIFSYTGDESARGYAADLGIALQLTNILRDIAEDAERGRVYLPQDEITWFGYSDAELMAGEVTPDFRRLIAYQVDRARHYYDGGRRLLKHLPQRPRACVRVMAGVYSSILDEIDHDPEIIFTARAGPNNRRRLVLAGRELVRSLIP